MSGDTYESDGPDPDVQEMREDERFAAEREAVVRGIVDFIHGYGLEAAVKALMVAAERSRQ